MAKSEMVEFEEEMKGEGLDEGQISLCRDIIRGVYIGQNIKGHGMKGILRDNFFRFGPELMGPLLKHNYIRDFKSQSWIDHEWVGGFHSVYQTTEKGSKIGEIVVTNLVHKNKERIVGLLNKPPQKVSNFVINEHYLRKQKTGSKFTYPYSANISHPDSMNIFAYTWKDNFRRNDKIHRAWTAILSELEDLGLCIRTLYYSALVKNLNKECYVISPEVFTFLVEQCPKEAFTNTPEEYDKIKVYGVLSYSRSKVDKNKLWEKLIEAELKEEKIKEVIDEMAKEGITSEYRGFSSEAPFSINDEQGFNEWLEKNLIEPVIDPLVEQPKIEPTPDQDPKTVETEGKTPIKGGNGETMDPNPPIRPHHSDLKILLGHDENDKEIFWVPDGPNEKTRMVSGNILITGGAGSGKTETLKSLLYELNNQGYICLALGFHPDLGIDGFNTLPITAKSNIGINPLDFDSLDEEGGGLPTQVYNVVERLKNTYPTIGDIQESNLRDILEDAYKRHDITEDNETWKKPCPNFEDVEKILDEKISETSDKELLRLKNKLSKIFKFKIFSKLDTIDTKELFKESTILDLSKLPEDFLFLVSDTILRKIYRNLKLREPIKYEAKGKERFRIFIAIDEAKILVPSKKDDTKAIINIFGTEARKFGVGFIVSSQLTSHFGDDVLGNMATKIALKPLKDNIARENAKELSIDPKALMNIKKSGEGFVRFSNEKTKKVFIESYEKRKNK